jgi:hypothetical protein
VIVPQVSVVRSIVSPAAASPMASRRLPGPASSHVVTASVAPPRGSRLVPIASYARVRLWLPIRDE